MSNTVIVCIALMGILVFALGANVTRHRALRGDKGPQMPTDPSDRLLIAQRAQADWCTFCPHWAAFYASLESTLPIPPSPARDSTTLFLVLSPPPAISCF